MLAVNSNFENSVTSFKGARTSSKDIKIFQQLIDRIEINKVVTDAKLPKDVKKNILINKTTSEFSQMSWFEKIKLFFKRNS